MVRGDLNIFTEAKRMGQVRRDMLSELGSFGRVIKSRAMAHTGPAGNDIAFTENLDTAKGGHYSKFDEVKESSHIDATIGFRAEWTNVYKDGSVAGTDLYRNAGKTVEEILMGTGRMRDFSSSSQIQIANLAGEALERAGIAMANQYEADLWEVALPDDPNPQRMKPSVPTLMNHEADWLGVKPKDFGVWPVGHPWYGDGVPNDLASTDDARKYRNIPQVFYGKITDTTPQTSDQDISADDLTAYQVKMKARIRGLWVVPTHPDLYSQLSNSIRKEDGFQSFVRLEFGGYRLGVDAIRIHQAIYFADDRAPDNELWHVHVGDDSFGERSSYRAGFRTEFWGPETMWEDYQSIVDEMYMPDNINNVTGMLVGVDRTMPVWQKGWQDSQNEVDAMYNRIFGQWAFCGYRFKNYTVKAVDNIVKAT